MKCIFYTNLKTTINTGTIVVFSFILLYNYLFANRIILKYNKLIYIDIQFYKDIDTKVLIRSNRVKNE